MNFNSNLWGEADENDNLAKALFGPVSVEKKRNKKKSENVSRKDLERESKASKEFLKNMKALERKHHVVRFEVSDDDEAEKDGDDLRKRSKKNMKERQRKKRKKQEIRMQEGNQKKKNLDSDEEMFVDIDYDDPVSETAAKKPKLMTTPPKLQENDNTTLSKRKQKALIRERKLEKKRKREEEKEETKMNLENSKSIKQRKESPFVVDTKGLSKKKKLQIDSKIQSKKKKKLKEKTKESDDNRENSEVRNIMTKGEKTNKSGSGVNGINGKVQLKKKEKSKEKTEESTSNDGEVRNAQTIENKTKKSGNIVNGDEMVKNKYKKLKSKSKNNAAETERNGNLENKSNIWEKKELSTKNKVKKRNENATDLKISQSSIIDKNSLGENQVKKIPKTKKGLEENQMKKKKKTDAVFKIRNTEANEEKTKKSVGEDRMGTNENKNIRQSKIKNNAVETERNGNFEKKSNTAEKKGPSTKDKVKKNIGNETNVPIFSKSSPIVATGSLGSKHEAKLPREETKIKKGEEKVLKKKIDVAMENADKPEPENKLVKKKKTKAKVVVEEDNKMVVESKKVQNKSKKENKTVVPESTKNLSSLKTPIPSIHNKNVNSKSIFNKTKLFDILSKKTNISESDNQNTKPSTVKRQDETFETPKLSALRQRMSEQLNEARFRYLNEQLYTQSGPQAFKMFQNDQEAFNIYHKGFQSQVEKWPVNPVDVIIKQVNAMPKTHLIADFGCGNAKLAQSVKNKVHSFDLVPMNDLVTVCDISRVPLANKTVDVVVLCLSLMGTNLNDFIMEANRVLKIEGVLKIAEVESRITNTQTFIEQIKSFGFSLLEKDISNKMFHMFDFKKLRPATKSTIQNLELAPCLYKKR